MERAAPEGETGVFGDESKAVSPVPTVDLKMLHAKIGDLAQMRRIDELHFEYSFAGRRMLQGPLKGERFDIGRLHVTTLMKEVGIEAIYRQPTPLNRQLDTKSISICCANWRSPAPIRSGPLANPISVTGYA